MPFQKETVPRTSSLGISLFLDNKGNENAPESRRGAASTPGQRWRGLGRRAWGRPRSFAVLPRFSTAERGWLPRRAGKG